MPITEGRNYAAEVVGDVADLLPTGTMIATVIDINEGNSRAGQYMIAVQFRVEEPPPAKGLQHTEYFSIGYDGDPQAQLPETWDRRAGRRYCGPKKGLLAYAGVDRASNTRTDSQRLMGQQVGLAVTHRLEGDKRRDGSDNPFKGQERADVRFFKVGEREIGLTDETAKAPRAPRGTGAALGPSTLPAAVPAVTVACPKCQQPAPRETYVEHVRACRGVT